MLLLPKSFLPDRSNVMAHLENADNGFRNFYTSFDSTRPFERALKVK